jgi:hypothetical protein
LLTFDANAEVKGQAKDVFAYDIVLAEEGQSEGAKGNRMMMR